MARADADDTYEPDRFELQLKLLENNNNISLVGSNVKYIDKKEKFLSFSNLPIDHFDIWSRLFQSHCSFYNIFRKYVKKGALQ